MNKYKQQTQSLTFQQEFNPKGNEDFQVPVDYQLLCQQKSSLCLVFQLNESETLLIAGTKKGLLIFDFNEGKIQLRQEMNWIKNIQDAKFLTNNDFVILFTYGRCFKYSLDDAQVFQCQGEMFKIKGLISLHFNKTLNSVMFLCKSRVEFWEKDIEWIKDQIVKGSIRDTKINQKENLLVQSLRCDTLRILQLNNLKRWVKLQVILKIQAFQVCIVNDEMIAVKTKNSILLFQRNKYNRLFQIVQQICQLRSLRCIFYYFTGFQFIYNQHLSAIIFEHDGEVYIYRYLKDQNRFQFESSLNFNCIDVMGTFSENGKYFISWDNNSRQLKTHLNVKQ